MSISLPVHVSIQSERFESGAELAILREQDPRAGAVVSFEGVVRNHNDGVEVLALELEHYPGMTESVLLQRIEQAAARWPLLAVRVIHRVGYLALGEPIVFVGVSAAHRGAAFAACEYLMDYLKSEAPLWKREHTAAGARWLDARCSDQKALQRWQVPDRS